MFSGVIMAALKSQLFSNISQTDPLNFRQGDQPDYYRRVSEFLEFDANALSKIAGINKNSVRFDDRIPNLLKERLDQIANICSLVAEYFDGDAYKTALWFKTPNPMLGDVAPRDMIRLGRYKKLMKFINESRNTHETRAP